MESDFENEFHDFERWAFGECDFDMNFDFVEAWNALHGDLMLLDYEFDERNLDQMEALWNIYREKKNE